MTALKKKTKFIIILKYKWKNNRFGKGKIILKTKRSDRNHLTIYQELK
jgi:hypothetical protein